VKLRDRIALVTGAASGIGAATARRFAREGATVAINDAKPEGLDAQGALPGMRERAWGRIVNTSSIGSLGNIGQANYAASKAGVIGLTKTLALEYAKYGVTVNAIAPGPVMTAMLAGVPEAIRERIIAQVPVGRIASPDEVRGSRVFRRMMPRSSRAGHPRRRRDVGGDLRGGHEKRRADRSGVSSSVRRRAIATDLGGRQGVLRQRGGQARRCRRSGRRVGCRADGVPVPYLVDGRRGPIRPSAPGARAHVRLGTVGIHMPMPLRAAGWRISSWCSAWKLNQPAATRRS
jgi:hypothetical protein